MNKVVGSGKMEVITSKACSKMYADVTCTLGTKSFRDLQPPRPSTASNSPFSGLVICVTGLSKEAKKQVMDATERLGGQFSPHLHPQCTHLVVQSSYERKNGYVLKHGAKDCLYIVTLGWFVDSVRRNVRLNESLYSVKSYREVSMAKDDINKIGNGISCNPIAMLENVKQSNLIPRSRIQSLVEQKRKGSTFASHTFYVDPHVSAELRNKVVEAVLEEGAMVVNRWLVGHDVSHVVCEGSSVKKYIGHSNNVVTPQWVLKTVKEIKSQRLVHLSADLARHVGMTLSNVPQDENNYSTKTSHNEKQRIAILAKEEVRYRRGHHTQTLMKPLARSVLLDSINWIMSEPASTASILLEIKLDFGPCVWIWACNLNDTDESMKEPDACFVDFLRPLSEREKSELVFGYHFITILFPVDRFGEMGPSSRTFVSTTGFTILQLLNHIYAFYQENMSASEIELAIHTDSRHADRLRSMYSSKEAAECGCVEIKRIEFLGSHRIFKMLKHVPVNYSDHAYELLTRA